MPSHQRRICSTVTGRQVAGWRTYPSSSVPGAIASAQPRFFSAETPRAAALWVDRPAPDRVPNTGRPGTVTMHVQSATAASVLYSLLFRLPVTELHENSDPCAQASRGELGSADSERFAAFRNSWAQVWARLGGDQRRLMASRPRMITLPRAGGRRALSCRRTCARRRRGRTRPAGSSRTPASS